MTKEEAIEIVRKGGGNLYPYMNEQPLVRYNGNDVNVFYAIEYLIYEHNYKHIT